MDDAGVGVDIAPEAHLLSQNVLKEHPVEGKTAGVEGKIPALQILLDGGFMGGRHGIVGHDGGNVFCHGGNKAWQMVFHQGTGGGIDIPLSRGIMGIEAVFPGAAPGEMLDGESHAGIGDTFFGTLDPGNDPLQDPADQGGVFTEGAVGPLPVGIGHTVCHIHIALAQIAGFPAFPDGFGPFVGHLRAAAQNGGGNAQSTGPCGENAGGIIHTVDDPAVFIPGVGGRLDRYEMFTGFCHGLKLVQVICQVFRRSVLPENGVTGKPVPDQHRGAGEILLTENGFQVHFPFVQTAAFVRCCHMVFQPPGGVFGPHAPVGNEKLPQFLIQSHKFDIGLRPPDRRAAPVVDRGEGAGAVDILEIQPVPLYDGADYRGDGGAAGIAVGFEIVRGFDCHGDSSSF